MKNILTQLRTFTGLYSVWTWSLLLAACAVSVWLNYGFGLQKTIDGLSDPLQFAAYSVLYASHALLAYACVAVSGTDMGFMKKADFIWLFFFSVIVFSFRAVVWQHRELIELMSPEGSIRINRMVFNDVFRSLYLIVPVSILWYFRDRKEMPLYGFSRQKHSFIIYWYLLLFMVPLVVTAGFLSDFLDYYPRFRKLVWLGATPLSTMMYELFYGMDFISIELFFRGFMVIAFVRHAGIHAVLPMAAFYLSIHYGKPAGEAISSFFGGVVLGVISYHSRSIYGGILVHVGIAWMMELIAYTGNQIRGSWP